MLPLLPAFIEKYPDIELDLQFDDRIGDLVKEGADVGIGVMLNQDSRLIARDFYKLQPVLVANSDYIEKFGEPKTPDDLSQHNCIAYRSSTTGRKKTWDFRVNGEVIHREPQGNLTVNSLSAAIKAVEMGWVLRPWALVMPRPVSSRAAFAACCVNTRPIPFR
ncbi:substrate binding domain-containing protein [Oceanimonas sp. NS1]|nr:substrate binding domain-containing protein [Oceanimonas sp. NS1]